MRQEMCIVALDIYSFESGIHLYFPLKVEILPDNKLPDTLFLASSTNGGHKSQIKGI